MSQASEKESPQIKNSKVIDKEFLGKHPRKSQVLEQENQELKSQIELLKAALLGLCKDKQVELPSLMPLLQADQNSHPEKGASKQHFELSCIKGNGDGSLSSSPAKSTQRRKRD